MGNPNSEATTTPSVTYSFEASRRGGCARSSAFERGMSFSLPFPIQDLGIQSYKPLPDLVQRILIGRCTRCSREPLAKLSVCRHLCDQSRELFRVFPLKAVLPFHEPGFVFRKVSHHEREAAGGRLQQYQRLSLSVRREEEQISTRESGLHIVGKPGHMEVLRPITKPLFYPRVEPNGAPALPVPDKIVLGEHGGHVDEVEDPLSGYDVPGGDNGKTGEGKILPPLSRGRLSSPAIGPRNSCTLGV